MESEAVEVGVTRKSDKVNFEQKPEPKEGQILGELQEKNTPSREHITTKVLPALQ